MITVLSFALYFFLDDLYFNELRAWLDTHINYKGISHILSYAIHGIPLLIGAGLMHGTKGVPGSLGLDRSVIRALAFALVCTLPMLLGFAWKFDFNSEISWNHILISVVAAAFFEEVYFRGFLFGQLYRFTKLGFVPSVLLGSFLFAFMHLYQSDELGTLIGIFSTTFIGAVLFAWAYVEWENNIWVPVFLHFFMNLYWALFSVSDNAFGGALSNTLRMLTIILIVGLTWSYKRKRARRMEVNKNTWWMKR